MLNIVAGVLLFLSSIYIGMGIFNVYTSKLNFLKEFQSFIDFSEGEIGFFKTEIGGLVQKYMNKHPAEFSRILTSMQAESEGRLPNWMSDELKIFLKEFLSGIKDLDRSSQKLFFERYRTECQGLVERQEKEREIKGKTARKLCPLLGLALFVMIL